MKTIPNYLLVVLAVIGFSCAIYFRLTSIQTSLELRDLQQLIQEEIRKDKHGQLSVIASLKSMKSKRAESDRLNHDDGYFSKAQTNHNTGVKRSKIGKENMLHEGNRTNKETLNIRGSNSKKKYLVYLCDSRRGCSGWGDRQRGVVAAYLLAVVTGRKFVVNMTSPCNVRNFLQPNHYRWDTLASELAGKSSCTIGSVRDTTYDKVVRYKDVNKVFPYDVIYLRSSSDLLNAIKMNPLYKDNIPNWAKTQRPAAFKHGWDVLMKPTWYLKKRLDNILRTVDPSKEGDLVCTHVRIGKNPSLPNDSPNRNSVESVKVLWEFLDPFVRNASRVFIATDSLDVREMARRRFGKKALDTGGEILHIDRQRKSAAACEGFETVVLEQLVLTKCHVLVVSASNFSIRAAFLRGRKDHLYMFKNATVTPFNMGT